MGNKLFQLARDAVYEAEVSAQSEGAETVVEKINKAKNALSSAFANSNFAEHQQLQELQQRLEEIENRFC
ncbi:DUF3813 domain-containing protein [Calidifontibacillus erzurumensis]|uniref:DUF3813 domain-containing protein n=1 Tax=Calidifontibacillus erzurumensis TaxID=2741433 RepID=A0A8J8GDF6_9BACI|nr:DUF3813 domain-containing protein [Calidifontibacillus erzurumensis]NSL51509.1 DUF3813 domain-containing protein [Calidifontibacillus erzurumensis]